MEINVTYDSSVSGAPAAFATAITYVINLFDSLFTNPIIINIDVGWGEIDGQSLVSNALGESEESAAPAYSYSTIQNALISTANASGDPSQLAAISTLPAGDPTGGGNFDIGTADAKALGLVTGDSSAIDGYIGFSSSVSWSFTAGETPAENVYYLIGVAEHEITEVMGRDSLLGETANYPHAYTVMDLYRYSSDGVHDLKAGRRGGTAYFSINNGTTNLGTWNNQASNGDLGDWYPNGPAPGGNDAFNDYSSSGVIGALTTTDITLMNVIGWDTSITPTEIPNGVTGWVASGQTSSGFMVLSGGYLEVGSGGIVNATSLSGGSMQIDSGGTASGTSVSSGGEMYIAGSGAAGGTQLTVGGLYYVFSGGVDSGTTAGGGIEIVSAGGTASGTVLSGGAEAVYGSAVSAEVQSGGALIVSSGGVASGTTVSAGGLDYVFSSGVDHGTTLSGGVEIVSAGGTTSGTVLSSGAEAVYGSAVSAVVQSDGALIVSSGGTASGTRLISAGTIDYVLSGGSDSGTTGSGGIEVVSAGGTASGTVLSGGAEADLGRAVSTTLLSGAALIVYSGGLASGTRLISAGTIDYVLSGGVDSGTTATGGIEVVSAGGTASGTVLSGGAEADLGSAVSTTVQSGAIILVSSGGAASGTRLSAGGDDYVLSGGVDSGTVAFSSSIEVVEAGGTASGTILSGGAEQLYGSAVSAMVQSGGVLIVFSGGTASGTQLSAGGVDYVLSDGIDNSTTVLGGTEVVSAGGTASGTMISGGAEAVYGSAATTTVQTNGFLIVSSGGVASAATLSSGGTGFVSSDGTAANTTVLSGGYELAYSGGLVSGASLSGGSLELQSGGSGSGTFDFASGGLLTLDGTGSYGMLVAGFTSATAEIDLTQIAFAGLTSSSLSWTPSTGSGTLTISSGVNSASILLLGSYMASDFSVKADNGTGTIVYDPPQMAETNPNPLTTPHQA